MSKKFLSTILSSAADSSYGLEIIVFNIVLAFILSVFISLIYKKTHRGVSYSQSFLYTLILVSIIAAVAMMVVGNNITRAFALLGTFSIIRFRTAVKDTKDTAYVFFALVIGIAIGTGNYEIATVSTLLILLIIYLMYLSNFGSIRRYDYLLNFILDTKITDNDIFKDIFEKFLKSKVLLNVAAIEDGNRLEFNFNVHLKNRTLSGDFTEELGKLKGISNVSLISAKNDVEY